MKDTPRLYLTLKERRAKFEEQGGAFDAAGNMIALADCGCGCGQPVAFETCHGAHAKKARCFGNGDKPDSLWRAECNQEAGKEESALCNKADAVGRKLTPKTGLSLEEKRARKAERRSGQKIKSRNDLGGDEYRRKKAYAEANKQKEAAR